MGNLEKELGQLKARHAKQVSELEQEINKSKELAETYEESLKKSTESLLLAK